MKELRVLKSFNILIPILTIFFFSGTIGYWFYLKERSEDNYKLLNGVNDLKLTDKEIDNALFSKSLFNKPKFVEQKLKRFEREIYFLKDRPMFKTYINNNINSHYKNIEKSFLNKKRLVYKIRDKKMKLKDLVYLASTVQKKDDFYIFAIENIKFMQFYQKAIINIINGERYVELQTMQDQIKTFEDSNNTFIRETVQHLKDMMTLSLEIETLNIYIFERDLFKKITLFENALIKEFQTTKHLSDSIFYIFIFLSIIFLGLLSYVFIREQKLKDKIDILNMSLKKRVEKEVLQNREKDKLIFQQSKLASLGEMIGNIAHQWRQPLNTLGIIIQDVENAYHFEGLDDEYIESFSEDAMKQISYMSATIDDFRNFSKGDAEGQPFSIQDAVINSIKITDIGLKGNNINLTQEIRDDCKIKGLKNQYIQVLINLIKNAQDILVEKKVEKPNINITLKIENSYSVLLISDNGGGIPVEIIDKIFEPYFTTKHQSVGTGLGLYMSKTIVEKKFKGKLTVENRDNGAIFKIVVPIFKEKSLLHDFKKIV